MPGRQNGSLKFLSLGSFSACSASVGKSRDINDRPGNNRLSVEVLPFWRAPVKTTTGRVRAARFRCSSRNRDIHICKLFDHIEYFAIISLGRLSLCHLFMGGLHAFEPANASFISNCIIQNECNIMSAIPTAHQRVLELARPIPRARAHAIG